MISLKYRTKKVELTEVESRVTSARTWESTKDIYQRIQNPLGWKNLVQHSKNGFFTITEVKHYKFCSTKKFENDNSYLTST